MQKNSCRVSSWLRTGKTVSELEFIEIPCSNPVRKSTSHLCKDHYWQLIFEENRICEVCKDPVLRPDLPVIRCSICRKQQN